MKKSLFTILIFIFGLNPVYTQEYRHLKQVEERMIDFRNSYPNIKDMNITSLGKSTGGRNIPLITIGKDDPLTPGILLVAGIDGAHPAGSNILLNVIATILSKNPEWLSSHVLYILPVLNPDAYQHYFNDEIKYERYGNDRKIDADRDGLFNEDPFDDLDGDGLITTVRIKDPGGNMTVHDTYTNVLVPVKSRDSAEVFYRVIAEGIDNDKDGHFNEDGTDGVHLNKNFSYKYPAFSNSAGEHAMSEVENLALADFLFDRYNIHTVLHFGLENNLSHPVSFDVSKIKDRVITGPYEKDAKVNDFAAKLYQSSVDYKGAPKMPLKDGGFSSWAYFHYGRFSFVTPGWWAPIVDMPKDTTETEEAPKAKSGKKKGDTPYDIQYINWAEQNGIEDYFVEWTEIDHPDFPGLTTEVGGFKPFVRYNPPAGHLKEVIEKHYEFLNEYMLHMPKFEIQGINVEKIDKNTYRLRAQAVNTGNLPTHSEIGNKTQWVRKVRSQILLADDQSLLIGYPKDFHDAVQPGEAIDFNYLISGKGKVTLEVGSPMTGLFSIEVELK